ncbi:MAG: UDP-N-acetylmuramate dehydrogenase [Rikenellaceae bacterium]
MKREFYNISLSERNSFKIDQSAAKLIEFDSVEELTELFSVDPPAEWYLLAGGNNVLFTQDYKGVILTPRGKSIEVVSSSCSEVKVRAEAGVEWDDFVEWSVENGLWGAENLSLIPGTVGAAPIQNIGAYGVEVKDIIEEVEMFCPQTLNILKLQGAHCDFGYRDSIFKGSLRGKVIVTAVTFKLSKIASPKLGYGDVVKEVAARTEVTLRNIREAICAIRTAKLPDTSKVGNAGSFFKNPVVDVALAAQIASRMADDMPQYPVKEDPTKVKLAAGWLIEKAGFKGYCEGRVGVHPKQALVLINLGGATGAEVMALANKIVEAVQSQFGVSISPEVNILP